MGMGMCYGLAELDNKAEFVHLGLELRLNLSFEDFPGWGGGGEKLGIKLKLSKVGSKLEKLQANI